MILLDTNILSELMQPQADANVVAWLDQHDSECLMISAVTAAELLYGIGRLPAGKRKADLLAAADTMLNQDFADRVLPFDALAAARYATLVVHREQSGRPIGMADAQIAAICLSHNAVLATRNTKDFVDIGLPLINPWLAAETDLAGSLG
ncbi:MAG: type II toxin-antitoxin system VapC family toxin [Myxococcales bacterium]|nr:type II toxin-antitoxin system VapC family toxin [Myxococcales bacterium]